MCPAVRRAAAAERCFPVSTRVSHVRFPQVLFDFEAFFFLCVVDVFTTLVLIVRSIPHSRRCHIERAPCTSATGAVRFAELGIHRPQTLDVFESSVLEPSWASLSKQPAALETQTHVAFGILGRFGKHENFYVCVDVDIAVTLQDILLLNFLIFLKNSQFDSFELQLLPSLLEVWSELFCMHGINNIFLSNCKLIQWCTGPHRVRFYVYVHIYVCVLCLPNLPIVNAVVCLSVGNAALQESLRQSSAGGKSF